MIDDERTWAVKRILFEYIKSPSLKHVRDPYSITKLAQEIAKRSIAATSFGASGQSIVIWW